MRKYLAMMLAALLLTGCQSQEQKREASPVRVETETVGLRTDYAQALYVWTVADGTARQTSVTTADTHGGRIVITDGLREGDTVITSGWQKLSEGTRVEAKK